MNDNYEYRLSWEMPKNHWWVAAQEDRFGRAVWVAEWEANQWDSPEWQSVEWSPVTRIDTNPWDQYNGLSKWADTHEQPIRNVKLERRTHPNPDEGWEVYERPADAARRVTNALMEGSVHGSDYA